MIDGVFWVQTVEVVNALVSLDLSNVSRPRKVDELSLGDGAWPHWISREPDGHRIVVTGYQALVHSVQLVEIDPDSGQLSMITGFRDPGSDQAGVRFDRESWPHGDAGPAVPHGAVFSRR